MVFNSDPTKQAQKVFFSRKSHSPKYPDLYFNSLVVDKVKTQKYLGLKIDERLTFSEHLKDKFAIVIKVLGCWKNWAIAFHVTLYLITFYKVFIRPHLDYPDIIYDRPSNMNICNKIESIQYNAALVITGAIRGSSKEKLYQELDFEYLI